LEKEENMLDDNKTQSMFHRDKGVTQIKSLHLISYAKIGPIWMSPE